jgi:hypothetical protein
MDTERQCTYTLGDLRCTNESLVDADRCEMHPHDKGGDTPAAPGPSPAPKDPKTTFERVKDAIALERLAELGAKAWKWIEEHWPDPDVFGLTTKSQLALIQQLTTESDPVVRKQAVSRLVDTLTDAQLLAILALAISTSGALRGSIGQASAGTDNDA